MLRIGAGIVLLLCLAAPAARADVVTFSNGDRWTGRLISMVEGKLRFAADLIGEVEVDAKEVRTIATDETVEVHANDGTVLIDALVADSQAPFQTAGRGRVGTQGFREKEVASINPPVKEAPEWEGSLTAGVKFERGNTIKDEGDLEVLGEYETEFNRFGLKASYEGERTTDRDSGASTTNDRNLFARILYDHFLGDRAFWYIGSSGEKDGPKDLDLRFTLGGGLGYKLFDRHDFKVDLRFGPAWVEENYKGSERDDDSVDVLARWHVWRKLADNLAFFHETNLRQSFEDIDVSLIKTETGLKFDLSNEIFLKAAVEWELDAEPASGTQRQDTDYILGLGYKF